MPGKIYVIGGLLCLIAWMALAQIPGGQSSRGPSFFEPALPTADVDVIHDIIFGKGEDTVLHADIARPRREPAGLMPAIVYIHGGGWKAGNYQGNGAYFLASRGYFTVSVQYRLDEVAKWPAQIEDCKLAVRWLRANAAKYHIDHNRIGCMGHSAGGHLVACLGTMGDVASYDQSGGYPGVSSKVQAVVDLDGPTDFVASLAPDDPLRAKMPTLLALFGASYAEKPELWKSASPVYYVKPGDPPFLVVHGEFDPTVPYAQATELVAALQKSGDKVQFITVKNAGHMLVAGRGRPPAVPDVATLRDEIAAFLDQNLKK